MSPQESPEAPSNRPTPRNARLNWLDDLDPPESADEKLKRETSRILDAFPDARDELQSLLSEEEFDSLRLSFAQSTNVRTTYPAILSGSLGLLFVKDGRRIEMDSGMSWREGQEEFQEAFAQALESLIDRLRRGAFDEEPSADMDGDIEPPVDYEVPTTVPEMQVAMQRHFDAIQELITSQGFEAAEDSLRPHIDAAVAIYNRGAFSQRILDMFSKPGIRDPESGKECHFIRDRNRFVLYLR